MPVKLSGGRVVVGAGPVKNRAYQNRKRRERVASAREAVGRSREAPEPQAEAHARRTLHAERSEASASGGEQVGNNFQAGLGKQLSSRVSSGAVSQERAEHTAKERALLAKAFGPDWRQHVYGSVGYVKNARKQLRAGSTDPNVAALYKKLMEDRAQEIARAEQILRERGEL